MGHGYSGSAPESQGSILLQAMGRREKEESEAHPLNDENQQNEGKLGCKYRKSTKISQIDGFDRR